MTLLVRLFRIGLLQRTELRHRGLRAYILEHSVKLERENESGTEQEMILHQTSIKVRERQSKGKE